MSDELTALRDELEGAVQAADSLEALEDARVRALGRRGAVTELMKSLGRTTPEERRARGQALNQLKQALTDAIAARKAALTEADLERRLAAERIDVTLPVQPAPEGSLHPISQTIDEIVQIFGEMGFRWAEGPDIEDDWYNFTALNIPPEHPARQEMDTFYLVGDAGSYRPGSAYPRDTEN